MPRAGFIVLTPLFVIVSIVVSTVTPALASPASGRASERMTLSSRFVTVAAGSAAGW